MDITKAAAVLLSIAAAVPFGLVAAGATRAFAGEPGRLSAGVRPVLLAILFGWAALVVPVGWTLAATLTLGIALFALAEIDLMVMRLPDPLTLPLIVAGLVKASVASLTRLPEKIELAAFANLATRMAEAEAIYLIGSKRAFPVTVYMALALSQLGVKNSLVDNVGSLAFEQIGFAGQRDVAFAISFSAQLPAIETSALKR